MHKYILLIEKAITNFNLSRWSVVCAAYFKYKGANDHKSTKRCMFEVGSNILIGSEICERPKPLMRLMANDFTT